MLKKLDITLFFYRSYSYQAVIGTARMPQSAEKQDMTTFEPRSNEGAILASLKAQLG